MDCQRTNYQLKDKFNHYGIILIAYYSLIERKKIVSLTENTKIDLASNLLPLTTDGKTLIKILLEIISAPLYLERKKNPHSTKFVKDYYQISKEAVKIVEKIEKMFSSSSFELEKNSLLKLFYEILLENNKNNSLKTEIEWLVNKKNNHEIYIILNYCRTSEEFLAIADELKKMKIDFTILSEKRKSIVFEYIITSNLALDSLVLLELINLFGKTSSKSIINDFLEGDRLERAYKKVDSNESEKNIKKIRENFQNIKF